MTTRAMVKVAQTGRRPAMLRPVSTAVAVATKAATWTISMTRMMAFMSFPPSLPGKVTWKAMRRNGLGEGEQRVPFRHEGGEIAGGGATGRRHGALQSGRRGLADWRQRPGQRLIVRGDARAMEDDVAAGDEGRLRAPGEGARERFHRDIVGHEQAVEADLAADDGPDDGRGERGGAVGVPGRI